MHDNIELLGNYISLGKIICKIVPSTLGDCKYISLLSFNNKYLRHRDGVIVEDEYIDDELFKNDSSFPLLYMMVRLNFIVLILD